MKITKPSQLREGMKLKGKWLRIPVSGVAYITTTDVWFLMPQMIRLTEQSRFSSGITDLESVEGIRAAKEGDVLVCGDDKCKLFLVSDIGVIRSYVNDLEESSGYFYTWEQLEDEGWKLKGEPNPEADLIEVNGKKYDTARLVYIDEIETFMKRVVNTTAIFMNKADFEIYGDLTYLRKRAMELLERIKEFEPID